MQTIQTSPFKRRKKTEIALSTCQPKFVYQLGFSQPVKRQFIDRADKGNVLRFFEAYLCHNYLNAINIDCQLLVNSTISILSAYGQPPAEGNYGQTCYKEICLQGCFINQYALGWQENQQSAKNCTCQETKKMSP